MKGMYHPTLSLKYRKNSLQLCMCQNEIEKGFQQTVLLFMKTEMPQLPLLTQTKNILQR